MDAGKLVSDEIVIAIVPERIDQPIAPMALFWMDSPHACAGDATEAMLKAKASIFQWSSS